MWLAQERLYWSNESDFALPIVKDLFSAAVFRSKDVFTLLTTILLM